LTHTSTLTTSGVYLHCSRRICGGELERAGVMAKIERAL